MMLIYRCPKNKDNEKVFVEECVIRGATGFKVLIDEGYVRTEYFYPVDKYSITDLIVYE